jgi:DNA topoisomerase IA
VQKGNGKNAKFVWNREKVFDYLVGLVLYEKALSEIECTITQVTKKQKLKYRPVPLSTIEYTKLASSKLRISSENAMAIAEKLYQKGFISYPRTETDSFKTSINLRQLVELHRSNPVWGSYVETMTQGNFNWPRNGGHDDNSHPPIHPVKSVTNSELTGDEWRVYELITRRFLACCSQDAKGYETRVEAAMGEETFHCKGIEITEENFLQIYVYMKWNEAELPNFEQGEKITPSSFLMNEHNTQPPSLLTESDLIAAMDNSGIGTDATIHQHIKTIQDRNYAEKTPNGLFKPTSLGLALVQGYSSIGATLHQPELRAKMEKEMNGIVNKTKVKDQVIQGILQEMKDVFTSVKRDFQVIAKIVRDTVGNEGFQSRSEVFCFKCGKQGHSASECDVLQRDESKMNVNEDKQEKTVICYKCKKPGHWANQCGVTPVVAEPGKVVCYKCGKEGHYATYCNGRVLTNNNKSEDQPIRTNDQDKKISEKKVCPKCGHLGRHPKGSECLKRKKN